VTEDQRKTAVAVLQESASTARRAYHRYMMDSNKNQEPAPSAHKFITHAEGCEAGIASLMKLTPSDA
jgi:hypothetical protein